MAGRAAGWLPGPRVRPRLTRPGLALGRRIGQSQGMSTGRPKPDRAVVVVRVMTLVSVALAGMCLWLAFAWTSERATAACWRTAAQFQYHPEDDCRG